MFEGSKGVQEILSWLLPYLASYDNPFAATYHSFAAVFTMVPMERAGMVHVACDVPEPTPQSVDVDVTATDEAPAMIVTAVVIGRLRVESAGMVRVIPDAMITPPASAAVIERLEAAPFDPRAEPIGLPPGVEPSDTRRLPVSGS